MTIELKKGIIALSSKPLSSRVSLAQVTLLTLQWRCMTAGTNPVP